MNSRCFSSRVSCRRKGRAVSCAERCSKFWFAASLLCGFFVAGLVLQLDFSFYHRQIAGNDGIQLIPKRTIMEIKSGGNGACGNDSDQTQY